MKSRLLILSLSLNALLLIALWQGFSTAAQGVGGGRPVVAVQNGDYNADGIIDISDASYLLNWLFLGGTPPAPCRRGVGALPATGQKACYDEGGTIVECEEPICPGQDGYYQAGCPNEGRYIANLDGTVTDTCTGLMWQQETAPGTYTRCEALEYCEQSTLAGYDDWRLPNVRELQSIVDYARVDPSIDPIFEAECSWYWSSTTYVANPNMAWDVNFCYGDVYSVYEGYHRYYLRAVRGGL